MPTYEYECQACQHALEVFQSINDPVKRKCPECGKLKLKRLFGTGAAVMFKGSGFYQTDYRSESYKKGAEKDKKATESSSSDSKGGDKKSQDAGKSKAKPDSASKPAKPASGSE